MDSLPYTRSDISEEEKKITWKIHLKKLSRCSSERQIFFNVKKEGNTHKGVFMRPNIHAFTIPVGDEETMKFSPTDEKYQSLIR